MPTVAFGEFRPDVNELDGQHTRSLLNVVPRGDGYGPFRALVSFTSALGAVCRGLFYGRNDDSTVTIFAATSQKLYRLDNTNFSWVDVSAGGGNYVALPGNANWSFTQFGDVVIAVNPNDDPQHYDLSSDSAFSDLGGTPPDAAYATTINRFVVLSGLTANPLRVQWSGLDDIENWTAGTGSGDFQDLPDGGPARPVVGGEFGIILQDFAVRRMIFNPGSETIFGIDRIAKDIGVLAPYSVCTSGNLVFFLSPQGFQQMDATGAMTPIGRERIDRTFALEWDEGQPQLMIGVADPRTHRVIFFYKTLGNSQQTFDKALVYDWLVKRWTPLVIEGEMAAPLALPGLTLEGLDALAPGAMAVTGAADNGSGLIRLLVASTATLTTGNYYTISGVNGTTEANNTWKITVIDGTHFDLIETPEGVASAFSNAYVDGGLLGGNADLMEVPWDDISTATLPNVSAVNTDHKAGVFTGATMEATLETPEQSGDGQRIQVNGFWPVTDATDVRGRISKRENLHAAITYTNETTMNGMGFCNMIRSTRYTRAKIRIPSDTEWTFATGVRPEVRADGQH